MSLGGKARAKFLCDAERCIECNACVTACKNENEVPWGINRRRVVTINDGKPGERSISVACMHCSDAPCMAVCPVDCFYQTDDGVVLHSKDCVSVVDIASMRVHSVRHSSRRRVTLDHEARWISAHSALVVLKRITRRQNSRSTEVTVLRKENCQLVPSSAPRKLCWPVTVTMSQRFIASVS